MTKKKKKRNKTKKKIIKEIRNNSKEVKASHFFSLQYFIKLFKRLFTHMKPYKSGWS